MAFSCVHICAQIITIVSLVYAWEVEWEGKEIFILKIEGELDH